MHTFLPKKLQQCFHKIALMALTAIPIFISPQLHATCTLTYEKVFSIHEDFESGFTHWIDQGSRVHLNKSGLHSVSGTNAAVIQDGLGPKSTIRQKEFDTSGIRLFSISFYYKAVSMENGDSFKLQYYNAEGRWVTVKTFIKGVDFKNNIATNFSVEVGSYWPGAAEFPASIGEHSRFRIRNFGSGRSDKVFIDDITVSGFIENEECISGTPTMTPTPTPTLAPREITLEAEDALPNGGDVRTYPDSHASNGSGIAYLDSVGERLIFENAPASDTITVRYASQLSGQLSIRVNDIDMTDIPFNSTGLWTGPDAYAETTIMLDVPDGATVALFYDDGDAAMNIDSITFILSGPTPTPTPSPIQSPMETTTIFCNYAPHSDSIDLSINPTLIVNCEALDDTMFNHPSLTASWNGEALTPTSFETSIGAAIATFEVDLLRLPTQRNNTFTARASGNNASASTTRDIEVTHGSTPNRVLIFSKTQGFRHTDTIPAGINMLNTMAAENGWEIDATEDSNQFTAENLANYDVVIWLCTTGDVLNDQQQQAFENYIESGGGFVGIHSASDTEYSWPWYGDLVGAYFNNHPEVQTATILVEDHAHASTAHLDPQWVHQDEWYNFRSNPRANVNVLMTVDETTYQPRDGAMGVDHPIAWYHTVGEGNAFYSSLGHVTQTYSNPKYIQHIEGAIIWAGKFLPQD